MELCSYCLKTGNWGKKPLFLRFLQESGDVQIISKLTMNLSHLRPRQVISGVSKHSTKAWRLETLTEAEHLGHLRRKYLPCGYVLFSDCFILTGADWRKVNLSENLQIEIRVIWHNFC